jgi:phage-related protein (TIGR01555 family)
MKRKETSKPFTPPVPPAVRRMRERLATLQGENAVLEAEDKKHRLTFLNSMSQLAGAAAFRQDNITSIAPLINANQFQVLTLQYPTLMYMYSTHGIIQTAVDEPVQDAYRDAPILECEDGLTPRNLEELEQWAEENTVREPFMDGSGWARLFGGSALVLNLAGDPSKPFDMEQQGSRREIERGRFALYPATRWELGGTWRYSDAYNFYGVKFDASRVKTMIGKRMPWILERQLSGWGASVIARMAEDFNVYLRGRNALYETLQEFKVDVYKMKGYNDQLVSPEGTAQVDKRIAYSNQLKGFNNALILDSEDDYIIKGAHFSGLADVMRENRMGLVSCTRIPASKLFGEKVAGLGSGDGDDLENYYNMVKAEVREPNRPVHQWIYQLGALALFGEKYRVKLQYPPLRETSAKDDIDVKTSKQALMLGQLEAGLIDEVTAAAWSAAEKLCPVPTRLGALADKKAGKVTEDVPSMKSKGGKNDKSQGAEHAGRKDGSRGDGRQAPRRG